MRVPGGRHGPDDAAHDELAALAAAGRVQHVEVVLAVLPPLELVEHAVGEGTETLSAAAGVIKVPSAFASPFEFGLCFCRIFAGVRPRTFIRNTFLTEFLHAIKNHLNFRLKIVTLLRRTQLSFSVEF